MGLASGSCQESLYWKLYFLQIARFVVIGGYSSGCVLLYLDALHSFDPYAAMTSQISLSVCIAKNKACAPNVDDYPFYDLCAYWLLFWKKNIWKCSVWRSPSCHYHRLWCEYDEDTEKYSLMGLDMLWIHHLIHSFVTAGLTALKNNAQMPAKTEPRECQQALDLWEVWIIVTNILICCPMRENDLILALRYL